MRNRGGIMAQVFPFSFKEFVSYFDGKDLQQAFDRFVMQKYKIKNIPLFRHSK